MRLWLGIAQHTYEKYLGSNVDAHETRTWTESIVSSSTGDDEDGITVSTTPMSLDCGIEHTYDWFCRQAGLWQILVCWEMRPTVRKSARFGIL